MLIILREFELNTIHRRRDRVDRQDLTKARIIENSLQFSEDEVRNALKLATGRDQLLFLDLRMLPKVATLPDDDESEAADGPPELVIPAVERFVYHEAPSMKCLKTYRLEYLISREGRESREPYETTINGQKTIVHPAPTFERIESSLECEPEDLGKAVALLASEANGFLSWLRITLHDDIFSAGRARSSHGILRADFAEPVNQKPLPAELTPIRR